MTGGRLRRVREYLDQGSFCFTYGDAVADVDVSALIKHHHSHGRLATVTAVQPPGRFGSLKIGDRNEAKGFQEKPQGDGAWINGGFFILEPSVIDRIDGDATVWEQEPLKSLADEGQLTAYHHHGFWQPMDTLRDRSHLEELWNQDRAPWRLW